MLVAHARVRHPEALAGAPPRRLYSCQDAALLALLLLAPTSAYLMLSAAERHCGVCPPVQTQEMVDKATGKSKGKFKTYAICGAICRVGESDASYSLAEADGVV